jgi:hypothetical protein
MNVEIGAKAAQLPEKEFINGIFLQCVNKMVKKPTHASVPLKSSEVCVCVCVCVLCDEAHARIIL